VTRVSLGIQSFNPRHLKALGRIHDDAEARRAAELAGTHFDTFNLDLMLALPGQTLAEALADIDTALTYQPPHLSAYHLTLEPNTPFGHTAPPNLPDDDLAADMQQAIEARLIEAGLQHYETSAYARPATRQPPQPQLLAIRRLPRHRRRRAFQAQLPRPHRAADAGEASAAVHGGGESRHPCWPTSASSRAPTCRSSS
jgi:coproporphyrinogen III oxidase-like Fe-S oxidoreductase